MPAKSKRATSPISPGHPTKKAKLNASLETTTSSENSKQAEESRKIENEPQTALVYLRI
jgi:hypothetical protein